MLVKIVARCVGERESVHPPRVKMKFTWRLKERGLISINKHRCVSSDTSRDAFRSIARY